MLPLIAFSLWLLFLSVFTFLFWLRPSSFFSPYLEQISRKTAIDFYSLIAALLAILLFLSCFLMGLWLSIARMRGEL